MGFFPLTPRYTQLVAKGISPSDSDDHASDDLFTTYAVAATILFTLVVYLFESYLSLRQRSTFFVKDFPPQLEVTVGRIDAEQEQEDTKDGEGEDATTKSAEPSDKKEGEEEDAAKKKAKVDRSAPLLPQLRSKFAPAQSYGLDKIHFSLASQLYGTVEGVAFLLLGVTPWIWDASCRTGATYFGWTEAENEIKISLVFLGYTALLGMVTGLPFELYSTFQIEKKHGFNKQTIGLFVTDKIKGLGLTVAIGGPFVALLLKLIKWGGENFYVYVWAFTFVFSLFMMTVYPVVIMPLFNKYEPLKDGSLKERIYELAGRLSFPLTKLFVMDGSKRSSHSNAFMFGFMKNKRIVLFDTLMEQVQDDEILAILGHELGHWKMGHTLTNFAIGQIYTGAMFYAFSLCYRSDTLYGAFGFNDPSRPVPTLIALLLFTGTVWEPIDKAISYAMTVHSRKCEFEADKFAVDLGMNRKLQSGLCKIHLENLGAMRPDPWYSTYHYSHPPLVERLSAMMSLDKKLK